VYTPTFPSGESMATKRILIVDDEQIIVDLLTAILTDQGFEVDFALDAASALTKVRESIFDAAILDFNLPDMNGLMLHREIRQMDEELADNTLFASGVEQSEKNLDYYTSYGKGFISKPFEAQEILSAVNRLLQEPPDVSAEPLRRASFPSPSRR
jgi:DNA-binding response OmpR family regulator